MTINESILEKLRQLSSADQQRILEAINTLVVKEPGGAGSNKGDRLHENWSIWAKLQAIGEEAEKISSELPPDLAVNHDFYLHGLPRRS